MPRRRDRLRHTSVTYYDENNRLSYTGRVLNDGVTALRTFSADSLEDGSKYVYTAYEDGGYVSYYYNETKQTYSRARRRSAMGLQLLAGRRRS